MIKNVVDKWDYKGYSNGEYYFGEQRDWNQTLITKFNTLAQGIYNFPITIESPEKFKHVFESLEFYDELIQKLNIKYPCVVVFTNSDNNVISVGGKDLEILNYEDK